MKTIYAVVILAVLLAVFAGKLHAEQDEGVRKPVRATEGQNQPRRVGTRKDNIPVLVADKSARVAPQWASQPVAAGNAMSGAATTLAAPPKTELEKVTLTVRKPYTQHADLMLRLATGNTIGNYAFWYTDIQTVDHATVGAGLNVIAGERYLLDYHINSNMSATYTLSAGDATQDIELKSGEHHLLVYLDANETGRTVTLLKSDKAKYTFYSLSVTHVE